MSELGTQGQYEKVRTKPPITDDAASDARVANPIKSAGKGDRNRTSNNKAYRQSKIWDVMGPRKQYPEEEDGKTTTDS